MTPEAQQRHDDLGKTVARLSNGSRGDPLVMSDGIVNISKTLQVILASNYITREFCKDSHDKLIKEYEKPQFTWKALGAVIAICSTFFGLGHHLINTIWGSKEKVVELVIESIEYFV